MKLLVADSHHQFMAASAAFDYAYDVARDFGQWLGKGQDQDQDQDQGQDQPEDFPTMDGPSAVPSSSDRVALV